MDQEREDYADLDRLRPRRLWYGSVGFAVLGAVVAGGTLAAAAFAMGDQTPPGTWVVGFVAVPGPYLLIFAAARRAGAGGRGRGLIQVCGLVVVVTGLLFLVTAVSDATDRARRGGPRDMPGMLFAGGPVFLAQWIASALAALVARPARSAA